MAIDVFPLSWDDSIALDTEFNSLTRPINGRLIFKPLPSKNFLSLGRGQLGAVGGGSHTLFYDKHMLASSIA